MHLNNLHLAKARRIKEALDGRLIIEVNEVDICPYLHYVEGKRHFLLGHYKGRPRCMSLFSFGNIHSLILKSECFSPDTNILNLHRSQSIDQLQASGSNIQIVNCVDGIHLPKSDSV